MVAAVWQCLLYGRARSYFLERDKQPLITTLNLNIDCLEWFFKMKLASLKNRHFRVSFGILNDFKRFIILKTEAFKVWRMRANLRPDVADALSMSNIPNPSFGLFPMSYLIKSLINWKLMFSAILQYQFLWLLISNETSFCGMNFEPSLAVWLFEMAGELGFSSIQ